jgi:hypothetical protein
MMRVIGALAALCWLMIGSAQAAEVQVTFTLPAGFDDTPVSWSATPLDLAPDADVLAAMVMEPDSAPGPWRVVLTPGEYLISAFSNVEVFELTTALTAEPATQTYEVPLLSLEATVAYRCDGAGPCSITDAATGLGFDLPGGWAAELPYFADMGNGEHATEVSIVFYQDTEDEGAAVWFLNPVDWVEDEAGPCRDVAAGLMCTFDEGTAAETGFAVIAPSLRLGAKTAP